MAKSTFEEVIAEQGVLVYTNVGDSMYPLIKPRDLLVIKKPDYPLKRFDVPLYKRDNGQYVLHRIVRVRKGRYFICGDNRAEIETGVTDRHIIGVLTDIIRKEKMISVYRFDKRIYAFLWCNYPLKKTLFYMKAVLRRIARCFKKDAK
ncbi:MAG: S24/S26 family peptidase [Ruminococcus sp.]|nr:S24/S26 family peptidase [Ruminococcus sp.]